MAAITTSTRKAIREQVIKDWGLGVALLADANGADTTHFQDNTVRTIKADPNILRVDAPFVLTSTDASGPAWGSEARLTSTAITSAGIIEVAPALDASKAPQSAQTAEVWHRDLDSVERVNEAIDFVLERVCSRWGFYPLTRLPDGDMRLVNASVATNWSVTNATQARELFAFPELALGYHVHKVTASATGGYSYQNMNATENETWELQATVRCTSGDSAKIQVYDNTNSVEISLSGRAQETDVSDVVWLRNTFTVPADCEQFQVRLVSQANTDVVYWGPVALWRQGDKEIPFQERVTSPDQVGGVFRYSGRSDLYSFSRGALTQWPGRQPTLHVAPGGLVARFSSGLDGSGPPVYAEKEHYINLSSTAAGAAKFATDDALTTYCPLEYVTAAVAHNLALRLYNLAERPGKVARPEGTVNPWGRLLQTSWRELVRMDSKHGAVPAKLAEYAARG